MKIIDFELPGLKRIEPRVFHDERGYFSERFNAGSFEKAGLPSVFFQDNHSRSKPGVLRGLHFQYNPPQGSETEFSRQLAGQEPNKGTEAEVSQIRGRRLRFSHVFMLPQPSDRVVLETAFVSAP